MENGNRHPFSTASYWGAIRIYNTNNRLQDGHPTMWKFPTPFDIYNASNHHSSIAPQMSPMASEDTQFFDTRDVILLMHFTTKPNLRLWGSQREWVENAMSLALQVREPILQISNRRKSTEHPRIRSSCTPFLHWRLAIVKYFWAEWQIRLSWVLSCLPGSQRRSGYLVHLHILFLLSAWL
jgi:hypothetical protein